MRPKRLIPLAIFLVAALISGWLAPPGLGRIWAASGSSPGTSVGRLSGDLALRSGREPDATSIQAAEIPATISVLLLVEDSETYLPLILR